MPVLIGLAMIVVMLVLIVLLAEFYPKQKPVELRIATIAMECGEDLDGNIRMMNALIDVLTTENPNLDLIVFGEMIIFSSFSMILVCKIDPIFSVLIYAIANRVSRPVYLYDKMRCSPSRER